MTPPDIVAAFGRYVAEAATSAARGVAMARSFWLDAHTIAAHEYLDALDLDESGTAACAAEGTGALVVDVATRADDEGLHEEEGS